MCRANCKLHACTIYTGLRDSQTDSCLSYISSSSSLLGVAIQVKSVNQAQLDDRAYTYVWYVIRTRSTGYISTVYSTVAARVRRSTKITRKYDMWEIAYNLFSCKIIFQASRLCYSNVKRVFIHCCHGAHHLPGTFKISPHSPYV